MAETPGTQPAPPARRPHRARLVGWLAWPLGGIASGLPAHGQTGPAAPSAEFDRAIALLAEARARFRDVTDYECHLVKRERVRGTLLPESVITMKVRNRPFSVYLHFESPEADRGMEVCYVEGRNGGMMRVQPAHALGVFGFWSVDPHDPRALAKSRHCVTEAGLGHLLEGTARYWDMERRLGATSVRITDDELGGRASTRIETVHPDRSAGAFYGYRCVLWLDRATRLPAGAETYDWPRPDAPEGGDLLERYRFLDLRCNVRLGESVFSH
jgi:hypothetical protein